MTDAVTINGRRWQLGQLIGSGGYGKVYEATCDGEVCAIKLIRKVDGGKQELLIADELRNVPNVIPLLGVGQDDLESHWALLMPRADKSLHQHAEEAPDRTLSGAEALPILIDIARALEGLQHVRSLEGDIGVVHRDLKPDNVLLWNGDWCLSDFGSARYVEAAMSQHTRLYIITPQYAAKERWLGEKATSETDIYALGVIAYELLMGHLPFMGPDFREQHLYAHPPAMEGVSASLAAIVEECLFKGSKTRPTPALLLDRLKRTTQAVSASASGGLAALQDANRFEATGFGQKSSEETRTENESDRRADLLDAARKRIARLTGQLRDEVLSAAPRSTFQETAAAGWKIALGPATLELFSIETEPEDLHTPAGAPFDVVAWCSIAVKGPKGQGREVKRAHSLWFCDAKEPGRYGWYETAFMENPQMPALPSSSSGSSGQRARSPELITVAGGPYARHAITALTTEARSEYVVAWPFTELVDQGLQDFIDRWAGWLAAAAQGQLRRPSIMPERSPRGSWRTATIHRQPARQASMPEPAEDLEDEEELAIAKATAAGVLRQIESVLQESYFREGGVPISQSTPMLCEKVLDLLWIHLGVVDEPAIVRRHMSDKDRPSYEPQRRWWRLFIPSEMVKQSYESLAPLRADNGKAYVERIYTTNNPRVVVIERRAPARGAESGMLLDAEVFVTPGAALDQRGISGRWVMSQELHNHVNQGFRGAPVSSLVELRGEGLPRQATKEQLAGIADALNEATRRRMKRQRLSTDPDSLHDE